MIEIRKKRFTLPLSQRRGLVGMGLIVLLCLAGIAAAEKAEMQKSTGRQQTFATPEVAVETLVAANRNNQIKELLTILGPHSAKLLFSGDAVADKEGRKKFVQAYDAAHQLESKGDDKRVLVVGKEAWPLPIPLVRTDEGWRFDTAAGAQEILNRRIGRNELSVINVCRAYVEAQREFAERNGQADGTPAYARRFHSTPGKHDGLYWHTRAGEEESPLGPLIAAAETEGYGRKAMQVRVPYHGYFYRILSAQGEQASGGAQQYLVGNRMTKGFALIAFPAQYGDSGVMTFLINQDGIVYEKNLGPKTAKLARQIKQYNPDRTWQMYKAAHP